MKRCLFCKKPSEKSKSREHIIPESIGSKLKVLPRGFVCDGCNNYFALKVEKPVLEHKSFRNIRAYYQISNKKGKMPSLLGKIAGTEIEISLKLDANNKPIIKPEKEKDKEQFKKEFTDRIISSSFSPLLFEVDLTPPETEMSRLLAKMALETIAYRYISDPQFTSSLVDEPYYDAIREYARYGNNRLSWPYHIRRIFPEDTLMWHEPVSKWVQAGFGIDLMLTSYPETYFIFLLYGVEFVINVGGPSISGYELWLQENKNISPVIERLGISLVEKTIAKKKQFYLIGDFDIRKGIEFDKKFYKKNNKHA